jgi:purine-nucleoside phosphorylase
VALQGPTFETPAEYGMIRAIGGDAVGMSTVPEVIVAKHQGMDCFGISIITDVGGPDIAFTVSHEEVLQAADKAMPNVIRIVKGLVKNYS